MPQSENHTPMDETNGGHAAKVVLIDQSTYQLSLSLYAKSLLSVLEKGECIAIDILCKMAAGWIYKPHF